MAEPPEARAASDGFSALSLGTALLRARRGVTRFVVVCAVAVALQALLSPASYSVMSSFQPQSRKADTGGGLAGIAAQFGVAVPGADGTQGANFYLALLRSRTLASQIASETYRWREDGAERAGTLIDAFRSRGTTPAIQREEAMIELLKRMEASANAKSGLVTFNVRTKWPELSLAIANVALRRLNEFNLRTRQSQATSERRFADRRLGEVRGELRVMQERLEQFIRQNRSYSGSPELQFQYERLRDELGVRQQVYSTLSQAVEQAKIEEARDVPVFTIVEQPELPARRDPRNTIARTLATLVVALFTAALWIIVRTLIRSGEVSDARTSREWARLRAATAFDLRRPWRLFFARREAR